MGTGGGGGGEREGVQKENRATADLWLGAGGGSRPLGSAPATATLNAASGGARWPVWIRRVRATPQKRAFCRHPPPAHSPQHRCRPVAARAFGPSHLSRGHPPDPRFIGWRLVPPRTPPPSVAAIQKRRGPPAAAAREAPPAGARVPPRCGWPVAPRSGGGETGAPRGVAPPQRPPARCPPPPSVCAPPRWLLRTQIEGSGQTAHAGRGLDLVLPVEYLGRAQRAGASGRCGRGDPPRAMKKRQTREARQGTAYKR